MRKTLFFILGLLFTVGFSYGQYTLSDYESVTLDFPNNQEAPAFSIVSNPNSQPTNTSATCGLAPTSDGWGGWGNISTNGLGGTFDFSSSYIFSMNVYAPVAGKIVFKIISTSGAAGDSEITVDVTAVNTWTTVNFDFTGNAPESGKYDKIALIFDGGQPRFNDWYFDDVVAPGFTPTPAKSTFHVTDYEGIVPEKVRLYDNGGTSSDLTLYNDGTNGDATANDKIWTAETTSVTGAIYSSPTGTGEYEWEILANNNPIAAKQSFTQLGEMTHSYTAQYAYKTSTAPTIDGSIDAMWANVSKIDISRTVSGSIDDAADFAASVKIAYDATNIYFLAEITDQTLNNAHGNDWEKDCFEIYFDINDDASYNGGVDGQKRWIWNNANAGSPGTSAQADVTGGWVLEISIPLADLATGFTLQDGLPIGIDFNANDNDGGNREAILSWHIKTDGAHNTPSGLGDVTLSTAKILIADDGSTTEGAESGEVITVTLENDTFVATLDKANWKIPNLPTGVTIGSVNKVNATTATITLSGNATVDYDVDIDLLVMADPDEFTSNTFHIQANSGATLTATVEVGTDASLSALTVSEGTLSPTFDASTYEYIVELPLTTTARPTLTPTVNEAGATTANDYAATLPGTTTVTVTSKNTLNTKQYKVKFVYPEPVVAAPTPPNRLPSEVISIFSAPYANISNTEFRAGWSNGDYAEVTIDGNATIKYTNTNWIGLLPGNNIDASTMEYLHFDLYTNNATTPFIKINNSAQYDIPVTKYEWVSYDIPFSVFQSVASDIYELKFEAGGATLFIDNIYFYRTIPTGKNPYLSDLKVLGSSIAGFIPSKTEYYYALANGTTSAPAITATTEDANASAVVTAAGSIPGTTTIVGTSQDQSVTETYSVNLIEAAPQAPARDAATVISIFSNAYSNISGVNMNPWWNQSTKFTLYVGDSTIKYANINWQGNEFTETDVTSMDFLNIDVLSTEATTVKFFAIANGVEKDTALSLAGNGWQNFDIPVAYFTNKGVDMTKLYQFKYDGQDMSTAPTIYVDNIYFYQANGVATLNDIKVNGNSVTGFNAATISYSVELPYGTTVVPTVVGVPTFEGADVVVTPASDLAGITTIAVKSEDGKTTKNYTVQYTIAKNSDATLSDIKVDGTSITGFDAATLVYNVTVPFGSAIPKVLATTTDVNADTAVTAATAIPGITTILVTAEDGSTTQTYTVNFTEVAPITISTLSDLMVNDVTISGFKADSTEYEYEVPYGTTVFPTVTYTVSDATAIEKLIPASIESKTDTVIVTAQDGSVTKYTVKFVFAAASTDATLSELALDGTPISGFKADSLKYSVELPFGTVDVPVVSAISTHDSATVAITQAATLNDTSFVVVTAQDGTTKKTYEVSYTVSAFISTDATLQNIKVSNVSVANFAADKYLYTVELPFETTAVPAVTGVKNNLAAKVVIDTAKTLLDTTVITVTAQDGTTVLVYKVAFSLADPVYDVTFIVSDGAKGLLKGAQVAFMLDTLTTDINGTVAFTQVSVTTDAAYSVTLEGYEDVTGTLSVVDADVTKNIVMTLKTYDVKFNVADEAGKAIAMAEVIFQNDTIKTDSTGLAAFNKIAPVTDAAYMVSKAGYFATAGKLSVVDTAVVANVALKLEAYDVKFAVIGVDSVAIAVADVIFNGDTVQTDSSGIALFKSVLPNITKSKAYAYAVSKEGYFTASDSISVVDSAVNVNVVLEKEAYDVTFTVVDGNANIVKEAQVVFLGDTVMTDTLGVALFAKVAPVTDTVYSVSKNGFVSVIDTIAVVDSAVNVKVVLQEVTYAVTFTVVDESSTAVEGAEVSVAGLSALTNAEGMAVINLAPITDAAFTVNKDGYVEASGALSVVDSAVAVAVTLEAVPAPTYTATFTIVDADNNAIEGAEVTLLETTVSTDAEGKAVFTELAPVTDAEYSVSKEGYETLTGNVTIVDADVEVDVQLIATGVKYDLSLISNIYPNPTSGILNIELSNSFTKAVVKVFSAQGQLVEHKELFEMHSKLDLNATKAGIYLVNIELDGRMYFGRIVINK